MKKHYEKMCMTPLGFVPGGNLLLASAVTEESYMVTNPGHELDTKAFDDSETFHTEWE